MKKLLIAAIALMGFTAASYAQTVPAKKHEPAKSQVAKKQAAKNETTQMVAIHKTKKPAGRTVNKTVAKTKSQQGANASMSKTTTVTTKTSSSKPLKKNGTPDMRYKANQNGVASSTPHLKKNGTPDKRYKENKKHS